ncbi:hypothetical protein EG103P2_00026 [Enterococcus phage EG103P2]|nr:hypothetical protein EG103P2_00026 [Enterococcus phage EG103P2]
MTKLTMKLEAIHDSRKSFYGKAIVIYDYVDSMETATMKLVSYDTEVASICEGVATVNGTYSQTTLRHIKEFLKQNGFKADSKSQIEKDYMKEGL